MPEDKRYTLEGLAILRSDVISTMFADLTRLEHPQEHLRRELEQEDILLYGALMQLAEGYAVSSTLDLAVDEDLREEIRDIFVRVYMTAAAETHALLKRQFAANKLEDTMK